ncbi:MAG TPA: hypothetical protein VIS76_01225 [Pseudomonadales bacterium]
MDVSIHNRRPGTGPGAGPSPFSSWCALFALLGYALLGAAPAHGYSVQRIGPNGTARLQPDDIFQAGTPLGRGTEQVFDQGFFQGELVDFGQPLDVNLSAALSGGALTARVSRRLAFEIRLTQAERDQCLTEADFDVSIRAVSPADSFASQSGGGDLQVLDFAPVYRDRQGGNCPSHLFYGYELSLGLDGAMAEGIYGATIEFSVAQVGGGPVETLQSSVEVGMPGFLLLYHPSQIQIDLRATAIAGALGATTACGEDGCVDLGSRTVSVSAIGSPIAVGLDSAVGAVATLQTITLQNAVGARATGCATGTYQTATYEVLNGTGGIQPGFGPISGIQGVACGLDLSTGDLQFDLDLNQTMSAGATATIQITVTGI